MRDLLRRLVAEPIRSLCHWIDAVFEWFDSLNVEDCLGRLQSGVGFIVVLALIGASGFVLYFGPTWYVNESVGPQVLKTPFRAFELENETRKTFTQIVLGFWGAVALSFVWRRVKAGEKTAEVAEQGHITERYTKAIEQLGKLENGEPNIEVRLGAIYALERIAYDSPRDQQTIMEVLCAYVRRNAVPPSAPPTNEPAGGETPNGAPPAEERTRIDIQAILTVIGRRQRNQRREQKSFQIDLSRAYLNGAHLCDAHLERANFFDTHLAYANLVDAHLEGANLSFVRLERAHFRWAHLNGANLEDTHMEGAAGLTVEQVKSATNWEHAHYDPEFRREFGLPDEQ